MNCRVWVCVVIVTLGLLYSVSGQVPLFSETADSPIAKVEDETATDHLKLAALMKKSDGNFVIPTGKYEFGGTLEVDLTQLGATALRCDGPVTIMMKAPGPAIRFLGSLKGTADPEQISPSTWLERMPLVDGIEIRGAHAEADGIELAGTMQATISRVTIRRVRHAIHLVKRNRNVIISDVHLYHNNGIGLYLDDVNLHQINVGNSHISYNRQGGIVVRGGNVRNLHVTGCDIEANMPNDTTPTKSANILIDQSENNNRSIAEIAITGCTIQHYAHYHPKKQAPGGANIRILGNDRHQPNMITITGNVISDTHTHLHLKKVTDVTVTGNTFFTTEPTDILVEDSKRVIIASCAFNPREAMKTGQIIFKNSSHCMLSGLTTHNLQAGRAAIMLDNCQYTRITDCIISGSQNGVFLSKSSHCIVSDCTVTGLPTKGSTVVGDLSQNTIRNMSAFSSSN